MMFSYMVYSLLWLFSMLPLKVLYFFSDICYFFVYRVFKYRRTVVRTNLTNAFPEKDQQEIIGIEQRYYHHLCDMFIEMYHMWHMSDNAIRRHCVFTNPNVVNRYFEEGKSVIGVLGHYGNWEWMSSFGLWMPAGVDFFMLYKPLHNRVADRQVFRLRSHFRATPVPRNDILREIIRNRREGRLFLAGFIGDQTPNRNNLHFWTQFLNQDTPVLLGTEKIARKFGLPVISLRMRKVKRGYYEVDFVDVCSEPEKLPEGELTRLHTRLLEGYIREAPELWLWSHKRWKHKRQEE